jgi:nuclear pore complex protein Nup98-Nup96
MSLCDDGCRTDDKRPSFGMKPSPPVLRQPRKYARVALVDTVEKDREGVKIDAGLSLGRSFRCSWGPNGEFVHFGKICAPSMKA